MGRNKKRSRKKPCKISYDCYSVRNELLVGLGFASYEDYLKSELWFGIRRGVLQASGSCIKCQGKAGEVHHSKYTIENLTGRSTKHMHSVCRECHQEAEFRGLVKLPLYRANINLGLVQATVIIDGRDPSEKMTRSGFKAYQRNFSKRN